MNDDPTGKATATPVIPQVSRPLELARRESDGAAIALLWSRETNTLAVSVVDARGGSFELVLTPDERPLNVYYHPYAYASLRGLVPGQQGCGPEELRAPDTGLLCTSCAGGADDPRCLSCGAAISAEVANGLSAMRAYLAGWAEFEAWISANEERRTGA